MFLILPVFIDFKKIIKNNMHASLDTSQHCYCQICLSTIRITDLDYEHSVIQKVFKSFKPCKLFEHVRFTKIETKVLRVYFARFPYLTNSQAKTLHQVLIESDFINEWTPVERLKMFWKNERYRSKKTKVK
jgi:hypothetical protein